MSTKEQSPRVFISYSWTTPAHEDRVLQLAERLCRFGVDAILDKWALREGHDINAFMERIDTDPSITKVIMICDREYVKKANRREAGVGIEAQIITTRLYEEQEQDKFVAVVVERDEHHRYCVPIFYGSRKFIDFTDISKDSETFEQLLRWIFEQPSHKKPEIGRIPDFLRGNHSDISDALSHPFECALDAIRRHQSNAFSLVREYFDALLKEMEKFRIDPENSDKFDNLVVENIESFLPHRNAIIQVFTSLSRNGFREESGRIVHGFLEKFIPYMLGSTNRSNRPCSEWDNDNFSFIAHELFLYAVACFLRDEQFDTVNYLLGQGYYISPDIEIYHSNMTDFNVFSRDLTSLDYRNQRLRLRRISLHSDFLQKRSNESGVEFRHLLQADLVLFLRAHLDNEIQYTGHKWIPLTLFNTPYEQSSFEIFARSCSRKYFNKVKDILGIKDKNTLGKFLNETFKNPQFTYSFLTDSFRRQAIRLDVLCGYDKIATSL